MEELNNRQIVLLCTLISFVTAIATGIITVAMLEEAPQTVTQTVNRVVERTIERVTQATSTPAAPQVTTVTKEVTVFAKEDDLIIAAVEKNLGKAIPIFPVDVATATAPAGLGVLVSRDGVLAVVLSDLMTVSPKTAKYSATINGVEYTVRHVSDDLSKISGPIGLMKIEGLGDKSLEPVVIGGKSDLKPGQSVVVLGGEAGDTIFKTTVSRLNVSTSGTGTSSTKLLSSVETNPPIPAKNNGALVVNLDGQIAGIVYWSEAGGKYLIYPTERILTLVSNPEAPKKEVQVTDGERAAG